MNWEEVEGNMLEMKGEIREGWGHLTDDEWTVLNGEFDPFAGKLKKKLAADKDLEEVEIGGGKNK